MPPMKGIEFGEVRNAIVNAFNSDEFDMFLFERLDFDRPQNVSNGPFKFVVEGVLKLAMQQGWDAALIAEVAKTRPLKSDVQAVYKKYAAALIDEARRDAVEQGIIEAYARYGLVPKVEFQIRVAGAKKSVEVPAIGAGFEAEVRKYIPTLDAHLWATRMLKLEGQVCKVEVGNGTVGTGFLVGPDAVLTNYHVLRDVIDGAAPATKVRFRFDYKQLATGATSDGVVAALAGPAKADWLVDSSKYSQAEADDEPDRAPPKTDELDYALVKLDKLVGAPDRGWIRLPAAEPHLAPEMAINILQHPNGEPLKVAFDTDARVALVHDGLRVRYATTTRGGSSGSPCFDINWNLIALHHYGDPAQHHDPKYNQGIPIHLIRARLTQLGRADALGGDPA
jgi:V8-like Glu-specific endopeptidase